MQTILSCPCPYGNNKFFWGCFLFVHSFRKQTNSSAIHERISQISFVKNNCAVHCWNAHPVSIILYSLPHTFENSFWMQNSFRNLRCFSPRFCKAENICICNRLCPQPATKNIPYYPSNACVCPSVRFKRR